MKIPITFNGRHASRKFIVSLVTLLASIYALHRGLNLCLTAQDFAIVMGAWGLVTGAVIKLYHDANLKDEGDPKP